MFQLTARTDSAQVPPRPANPFRQPGLRFTDVTADPQPTASQTAAPRRRQDRGRNSWTS